MPPQTNIETLPSPAAGIETPPLAPAIETLAELEGYQAHAAAVRIRFQSPS